MKKVTIYTNGESLFTLENYDKTAGVCHVNGITKHSEEDQIVVRAMHEKGQLHYVFGIGDRKEIANEKLRRNKKYGNFEVC